MALITADEFRAALRVGDSPEEQAETTRIYAYAVEAVEKYAASAPDVTKSEAIVRLGSYLFDQPTSARGDAYAAAGRNSGAWSILAPYRIRRAGTIGEAVQAARESGTKTNPVVDVKISGGQLVVSYADETSQAYDLPDGMGGGSGVDQTARDSASNAQTDADAAQAEIDAHEASTHNHDATARAAAATAQGAADTAQADLDTHEGTPHNTDGTARTAAAAAQDRADNAFALADGKVDPAGAASAAREVTADWAEAENPDPIPAPKLVNVVTAHEDIVNVLDGRLPGLPVAMRLGWSQTRTFTELDFARPLPPLGGSVAGLSGGLAAPPFPPGLASDPTLFLGIWLAGDPDVVEISGGGAQFGNQLPLSIDAGKVGGNPGVYVVSTARLRPLEGTIFSVTITGPRIVLESDLAAHASDPDAHHVPPAGMGGGPAVLYEAASVAIGGSTGLIAGDIICPETGGLEFYFEGLTGTRQGGVAYARIPAERVRGAASVLDAVYSNDTSNMLLISHGANRGIGVAVQTNTNFLLLAAQAPGDFYVRILHSLGVL